MTDTRGEPLAEPAQPAQAAPPAPRDDAARPARSAGSAPPGLPGGGGLPDHPVLAPAGHLGEAMGIVVTAAGPHEVTGTMPVAGNTQPYGLLHGGASVVLAESLGSIGAALHAGPGRIAVGVDINATHHRAARPGPRGDARVTGTATAIHLGRTTAAYEVVVTDEDGRRVCTSRITCQLMDAPPGSGSGA